MIILDNIEYKLITFSSGKMMKEKFLINNQTELFTDFENLEL